MTLHQINRPDYCAHMGAVVGTVCENAASDTARLAAQWTAHLVASTRSILAELATQLHHANDAFAAENAGLDPDTPAGKALDAAWHHLGAGPNQPLAEAHTILAAAQLGLDAVVTRVLAYRDTFTSEYEDSQDRADINDAAWDAIERADYHHAHTPDIGARLPIYNDEEA